MDIKIIILICIFMVSVFSIVIDIIVWIYKDSKARGVEPLLWVLIAIFGSPLIGLILYLAIGRKEEKVQCYNCGIMVMKSAKFCNNCGNAIQCKENNNRKSGKVYIIIGIVCTILAIASIVSAVTLDILGSNLHITSGYTVSSYETTFNNTWKYNFSRASDNYTSYKTLKYRDEDESLYIESQWDKGDIEVYLIQNDKEEKIQISNCSSEYRIPLDNYSKGKIEIKLVSKGAENAKLKFSIKNN